MEYIDYGKYPLSLLTKIYWLKAKHLANIFAIGLNVLVVALVAVSLVIPEASRLIEYALWSISG